ncbi:MAG: hypothetical protein HZB30_07450 [Nitrospirae bacterium]|nr:hypothetical protein [Nitrospirota bacterium]
MDTNLKKAVSSAIVRLLHPLLKILLRNGIPYGTFCELAKWVYVDVASREFVIQGRKQTDSRIATITGLSRKEVRRLRGISVFDDLGSPERYNRAVRVISGWRQDQDFLNSKGLPRELSFEGAQASFSSLVKSYSGDIPPRAILDEMLRAGVIDVKKGKIKLLSKGYIVKKEESQKIQILGDDVSELISTINHNLDCEASETFFQRKVSYDNIPEDVLVKLRKLLSKKSEDFTESIDKVISRYDRDVNPAVKEKGERRKAGLGIFYFE